ncbi:Putative ribonuclease H protein At1g65750 [Linum perenne]
MLATIPFGKISQGPPSASWTLTTSGDFSVSSWYSFLRGKKFPGLLDVPASMIWGKWVPSKISGFLWQVYHGNISTFDNLAKRGFIGPNLCVLCRAGLESVSHLFFGCTFAERIWRSFSSKISIFGPTRLEARAFIDGWQTRNCMVEFELFKKCLMHAILWYIWGERNSRIFRDRSSTTSVLVWRVALAVGRWLRAAGKVTMDEFGEWMALWTRPWDTG